MKHSSISVNSGQEYKSRLLIEMKCQVRETVAGTFAVKIKGPHKTEADTK